MVIWNAWGCGKGKLHTKLQINKNHPPHNPEFSPLSPSASSVTVCSSATLSHPRPFSLLSVPVSNSADLQSSSCPPDALDFPFFSYNLTATPNYTHLFSLPLCLVCSAVTWPTRPTPHLQLIPSATHHIYQDTSFVHCHSSKLPRCLIVFCFCGICICLLPVCCLPTGYFA